MFKVKLAPHVTIRTLRRLIGPFVIRRRRDGRLTISPPRDLSQRVFSEGQIQHQDRFRQAAAYATEAARTEPIYAERALGTRRTAYSLALSDWWHAPVIHQVLCTDGHIRIQASDNLLVTRVEIQVLDEQGKVIAQGEGVRGEGDRWEYLPSQQAGKAVTVRVWDLAGNVTKADL